MKLVKASKPGWNRLLNVKLIISYEGSGFCGFELQPKQRSVRGEIEKVLLKLFKQKISIISSSRTDSGVHALHNVVNFQVKTKIPVAKIKSALNGLLPKEIRIVKVETKPKSFNARYDAKKKTYEYLIYNGDEVPPQILGKVWHVRKKLDLKAMRQAAKYLVGKHDFSSFCASRSDDKNKIRILHKLVISHSSLVIWKGNPISVIRNQLEGNGFLYKMVRNIVGTLVEVGLGRRSPSEIKQILKAKHRKKAGRCAPAPGLCLIQVSY